MVSKEWKILKSVESIIKIQLTLAHINRIRFKSITLKLSMAVMFLILMVGLVGNFGFLFALGFSGLLFFFIMYGFTEKEYRQYNKKLNEIIKEANRDG